MVSISTNISDDCVFCYFRIISPTFTYVHINCIGYGAPNGKEHFLYLLIKRHNTNFVYMLLVLLSC